MRHFRHLTPLIACLAWNAQAQTFYKTYGSASGDEHGSSIVQCPDGNFAIGGTRNDSALVMKVDVLGGVIWTRTFKPQTTQMNNVGHLAIGSNGALIGCGTAYVWFPLGLGLVNSFYFSMDQAGNLQWVHASDDPRINYAARILPLAGTDLLLFSDLYESGSATTWADPIRERISTTTGDVLWSSPRLNYIASNPYIDDISGAVELNGSFYTTGRTYVDGANTSGMRPHLSKFNSVGDHVWSGYLLFPYGATARIYGNDIIAANDSLTIVWTGDPNGTSSNWSVGLIRCDTLGNVAWSKEYDLTGSSVEVTYDVEATSDGYVIGGFRTTTSGKDLFLLKTDLNGDLSWATAYGSPTMDESTIVNRLSNMTVAGGSIWLTACQEIPWTDRDLLLLRADLNGQIDCLTPQPITVIAATITPSSTLCTVNEVVDPIDHPVAPNAVGSSPMDEACALALDLGPDTIACTPYFLDASAPGSVTYLWQDGSTLPTMPVQGPGLYWVTISQGCCIASDSIQVTFELQANAAFVSTPVADPLFTWMFTYGVIGAGCDGSMYWDFGDGTTGTGPNPQHTFPGPGTYTVCLTIVCACDSATHCEDITILSTGIAEHATAHALGIAPQPAHATVWVYAIDQALMRLVTLIDATGREVMRVSIRSATAELDIASLPSGSYTVRISMHDGTVRTRRLLIVR